jgi:mRNA export factor
MWSLENNNQMIIGQHQAPVKHVSWVDEMQTIVTASWDKSVCFWTGKSPNADITIPLPERAYCMDIKGQFAVVGTADRHLVIYDIRKYGQEFRVRYFFKKFVSLL